MKNRDSFLWRISRTPKNYNGNSWEFFLLLTLSFADGYDILVNEIGGEVYEIYIYNSTHHIRWNSIQ